MITTMKKIFSCDLDHIMYNLKYMKKKIADKLNTFFTNYTRQFYRKGEILIQADEGPDGIFFLKNGHVKQYVISQNGDEVVVNIFKPICFFPMLWAVHNTSNKYYFEATTPVEVWKAPKDKVLELIKGDNELLFDLLSRVYVGTEGLLTRMIYLISGNAYTKLIVELLIHAKRFGTLSKNGISYEIKVTERDLGTHVGITRETVSRKMKVLKDRGLVKFNKNVLRIPDTTKLEAELSARF